MPGVSRKTAERPESLTRRLGLRLAVGVITIALSIGTAEILLRVVYGDVARITGATEWETARWKALTYAWDVYHPRFGWTNLAGYRSDEHGPFQLSINGQGLRGQRDYAPQPAAGTRRIALFGDSLAFGEEVDDDQTVPFALERILAHSEVLNFGVHGYGLGQMMLRLEEEGYEFDPDHVIVMLMLPRDLGRDLTNHFVHNKPAFAVRNGHLAIANLPVPEASQQRWLLRASFVAAFAFARAELFVVGQALPAQIALLQRLVERIRDGAQRRGVPWTLVTLTNALDVRRLEPGSDEFATLESMQQVVQALDVDQLDLIDFLRRRWRTEGPSLSTPNWHWSARGNCLIARRIADHLETRAAFARKQDDGAC